MVNGMSKLMEDRLKENAIQTAFLTRVQIATRMLMMDDFSYDEIAKATKLSLADIEDIARQLKEEAQQ